MLDRNQKSPYNYDDEMSIRNSLLEFTVAMSKGNNNYIWKGMLQAEQ